MIIVHAVATDRFGGVEQLVARLAAEQARAGHRVMVVGGDPVAMTSRMGPEVEHHAARGLVTCSRALGSAARSADVVNVHMTAAEVAAALSWSLRRTPMVATVHFSHPRAIGSGWARPLVAAVAQRRLDAQIAVSRFVAESVGGTSVGGTSLGKEPVVVHTGVPDRDLPTEPRDRTVLIAQRLEPEKHTDAALRIFAESMLAHHGWRLVVAGDGSARSRLVGLAADLGIAANTDFLGQRNDVATLMDHAGILLAPTPREGLGLTVLEAMSAGLPVLAAGSGGHLETVGAVTDGQLYADLPDGATRLRALAADEARRAAYGAALHRAQRELFTISAQVTATEAVYRRAMKARS